MSLAEREPEQVAYFAERFAEHRKWRQHLHAMPEIGFKEVETSDFIAGRLQSFGIEVTRGIAGTGLVGTLRGNRPGRTIGFRADMDALPIDEETQLEYRSRNPGFMHACGHDGHVTMLLAAAEYLAGHRDFAGTVHFIFQPAEETAGGGRVMVEKGLFERFPVDAVFALHNWPGLPVGQLAARPGPMMAAMDLFTVTLEAKGVHAAMPHLGTDAIVAAAQLVLAAQTIVSRTVNPVDPVVLSFTQVHAGNSLNALPQSLTLNGTVRSFSEEARAKVEERVRTISRAIALESDVALSVDYENRYPATINEASACAQAQRAAVALWGADAVMGDFTPSMASEDFAYMLNATPGCYAWIGAGDGPALHSPSYDFNDELIPLGASYWVTLAQTASAEPTP